VKNAGFVFFLGTIVAFLGEVLSNLERFCTFFVLRLAEPNLGVGRADVGRFFRHVLV